MAESGTGQIRRAVGAVGDPHSIGWWERLWAPFWVLPSAIAAGAAIMGVALPALDHLLGGELQLFPGNADSARNLLGTIASAMISVTGLVFSITMVVIQLASSQFTPRLLGSFLSSRVAQATLGVFTAAFVFALMVLRVIRGGEDGFVPQLSVTASFALVLASVVMFFAFIHHITESIQLGRVVDRIAAQTVAELEDWPDDVPGPDGEPSTFVAGPDAPQTPVTVAASHGVVERIQLSDLVRTAERADLVIELLTRPGEVHYLGQELAVIHGGRPDDQVIDQVRAAVSLGAQRTNAQDPEFGVRQLVDIAERALSPGVNDPTTAVQVLDALHQMLRLVVVRPDRSPLLLDAHGQVRVVDRPTTFARLLGLSTDEIAHYGRKAAQVPERILALLDDLESIARPEHATTIAAKRRQLALQPASDS